MPARSALVVEDSPAMRQLLVYALQRIRGMRVDEAENGLVALQKLAPPAWYDIILTDVNMPVMDGLKLVQRVRADAELREVPILVITTDSAAVDRAKAMALGATAYMTKPIQAPEIIRAVKGLLGLSE